MIGRWVPLAGSHCFFHIDSIAGENYQRRFEIADKVRGSLSTSQQTMNSSDALSLYSPTGNSANDDF